MDEKDMSLTKGIIIGSGGRGITAEDIARLKESNIGIVSAGDLINHDKIQELIRNGEAVIVASEDVHMFEQAAKLAEQIKPMEIPKEEPFFDNRAGRRARAKAEKKRKR